MNAQECSGISFSAQSPVRKGAEGTFVYKGLYQGESVAVKRVPYSKHSLFLREASLLTSLSHKNIVELSAQPHLDKIGGEEFGCLVMPWYEHDLSFFLNEPNPEEPYKIVENLLIPISRALKYVHSRHKSHRDIKPSNILLNNKFEPVIADFGVGKDLTQLGGQTVGAHSSRGYTPDLPGDPYQHDVYSFGVVMLELLVGHPTNSTINRDLELQNSNLPKNLANIIRRCLEYSPANRYRTMVEVCDAIEELLRLHKIRSEENSIFLTLNPNFKKVFRFSTQTSEHSLENKLTNLLSSENLSIRPTMNQEGEPPIDDFWVVGESFQMKVTGDPKTGTVHAVKYVHFEGFQRRKKSASMPLQPIYWKIIRKSSANTSAPNKNDRRTYLELRKQFELWLHAGRPTGNLDQISVEINDLLDTWSRTLDATEKVLKGKGAGLKFLAVREQGTGKDYIFELEEFIEGDLAGTFWEIEGLPGALGEVQIHEGNELALYFRRLPKRKLPTNGKLKSALDEGSRVVLERKREALESISEKRGANPRLGAMLSRAFSEQPPRPLDQIKWVKETLDDSKKIAVEIALGAGNVALVQGPPGTGKTEFIVELIGQILSRNPAASVLLVSQTHVALDNALQRLQSGNITDKLARLGNPESKSISESSKSLLPINQQSRWAKQLADRSTSYSTNLALEAGLEANMAVAVVNLMKIKDLFKQLEAIEKNLKTNDPEIQNDTAFEIKNKVKSDIAKKQDLLRGQVEGVKSPKNAEDAQELINAIAARVSGSLDFLQIIDTQTRWISKLLVSDQMESLFLKSRAVLAGTCLGFLSNPAARDLEFDYCILDEASRATPTESLVPFTKSKKVILVGDSNQLGTSYLELENQNSILKEYNLSKDDLKESLFTYLEDSLPNSLVASLSIQYRMANPIGKLISTCFYGGAIVSKGPQLLEGLNFIKFDDKTNKDFYKPIKWVDTSNVENHETPDRGSRYNNSEANEIVSSILSLSKMKSVGISKLPENLTILVIAPYAAQVNRIKKRLEKEAVENLNIDVLSVDAVQGREADLVFFSPVRSNADPGNIGFITRERINVALSRAKHSLVIVGNASFWDEGNSKLSDVYKYIQTLSESEAEIQVLT